MQTSSNRHRFLVCVLFGSSVWVLATPLVRAQQPAASPTPTQTELQELKADLRRIEARIDALEAAESTKSSGLAPARATVATVPVATASSSIQPVAPPPTTETAKSATPAATGAEAVKQAEDSGRDTMDAGMGGDTISIPHIPQMKFRGFGDVRGFLANVNLATIDNNPGSPTPAAQGGNSTFALGVMDLFITSQISEHFSYLAEMGFEADPGTNNMGIDLERAQISYMRSDRFSISAGRTHAMIGYYNTAFHHGTWFQTSIDRPRIYEFEDSGGPLPIHNVGLATMGSVPSGKLGLHWFAEVGNGKLSYSLAAGPAPANVLADHTGKSTNIGIFLRPDRFPGLQTGFDWYQASLVPVVSLLPSYGTPGFAFPNAVNYYHQNIYTAYVVYIDPKFELMAEATEDGDTARGSTKAMYTSGGYAQVSRVFASVWRPYFRYEWMNPNFNDPNNAWAGRWVGPKVGLRWDLNPFIALKTEFSDFDWRDFSEDPYGNQELPILHKTVHLLGSQLTYTF